jgi:lipid-A-disaccharide synthase
LLQKKIVIVTGELSGETHAAHLVRAIKDQTSLRFSGLGSAALAAEGVDIIHDYRDISLTGFTQIVTKGSKIKKAYQALKNHLDEVSPHLLILVDFGGFNLRLAAPLAKKLGIPIVYFIPPQVWASRRGRITRIKSLVDLVLCILPFEEAFYRERGIPVAYVGHPYARSVKETYSRDDFLSLVKADGRTPLITVMPGSRLKEVKKHMPVILQVAEHLDREVGRYTALLPVADSVGDNYIQSFVTRRNNIIPIRGHTYDCLKHSDAAIIKSGSSTLEAAILGVPSVVIYKMSYVEYLLGRMIVKVPHISLPNIIAGKEIFPEFIQSLDAGQIAKSVVSMLQSDTSPLKEEMDGVRKKLNISGPDPYRTAGNEIVRFLERTYGPLSETA